MSDRLAKNSFSPGSTVAELKSVFNSKPTEKVSVTVLVISVVSLSLYLTVSVCTVISTTSPVAFLNIIRVSSYPSSIPGSTAKTP